MRFVIKAGAGILIALVLILVVGAGAGLGWRAYRQHQTEKLLALSGPNAIRDGRYVTIGGIPQWISIRGENKANPVILVVHGGPGAGLSGEAAIFRGWEHDFTIVQWDQRGAGLTFAAGARLTPDVPLERMVGDGIEVAQYARRTLGANRLILVGHSWGSMLGVYMAKTRPDLFSAYVGTGQLMRFSDQMAMTYDTTLARARAAHNDEDVRTLEALGRPPYSTPEGTGRLLLTRNHYFNPTDSKFMGAGSESELSITMTSPDLSLGNAISSIRGMFLTAGSLDIYPPLAHVDLPALGCNFPVPFFVIEGDDDRFTYTALAKSYYDCVTAPHKEFLLIQGGHFAVLTNADAFHNALVQHVRPVVLASKAVTPSN